MSTFEEAKEAVADGKKAYIILNVGGLYSEVKQEKWYLDKKDILRKKPNDKTSCMTSLFERYRKDWVIE